MIHTKQRLFLIVPLVFVLLLFFSPPTVYAQSIENFTNDSGQTWIIWSWNLNNTDFAYVYQDGIFVTKSQLGNYTITTNPNEKHILTVMANNSTTLYTSEVFSKKQSFEGNLIYLFIIAVFFLLIGLKFPLFSLIATPFFFYGGTIALNQTNETWIILAFWLSGAFALLEFGFQMKRE